jgi:hypothetical protein
MKWHDGEEEWWRLELDVSTEESRRRLGIEGKWCGGVQGWSSPFCRARGSAGEVVTVGNRRC